MRVLKPAVTYFALVFGAGFALGAARTLWLVPRIGARAAELLELPLMLVVIALAARGIARRFAGRRGDSAWLAVGLVALALLLVAEVALGVTLRGASPGEVLTDRDPLSGVAYCAALGAYAIAPWWWARYGRSSPRGGPTSTLA